MIIITCQYSGKNENLAYDSWIRAGFLVERYKSLSFLSCSNEGINSVPKISEVVCRGFEKSDTVVLVNSDILLVKEAKELIQDQLLKNQCCYSHRRDYTVLPMNDRVSQEQILESGKTYRGRDLWAFTKEWWLRNRDPVGDMYIGREIFDWILTLKMGAEARIPDVCFHQIHQSYWSGHKTSVSNLHNRRIGLKWFEEEYKGPLDSVEKRVIQEWKESLK
jgi:hypothetical protein